VLGSANAKRKKTKCSALERLAGEQARQIQWLKTLLLEKQNVNK
jgi:hypothetical protein